MFTPSFPEPMKMFPYLVEGIWQMLLRLWTVWIMSPERCVRVCVYLCVCVLVVQSSPTLCDPVDCSTLGQTRIPEWVAISSPGDLPNPGSRPLSPAWQVSSLPLSHQGSPPRVDGHHQKPKGDKEGFCRDSQREHGPADTLLWDFEPLELWKNKFWQF